MQNYHRTRPNLRPKISSLPSQQSELANSLNLYKLAIEKKRIQQELYSVEQRRQQLLQRLSVLESQMSQLIGSVQQQQQASQPTNPHSQNSPSDNFDAFLLEY